MLTICGLLALIDGTLDLIFVVICYASQVIWLAVIVGLLYIYTFFDKVHSARKLIGIARDQRTRRFEKSILGEKQV